MDFFEIKIILTLVFFIDILLAILSLPIALVLLSRSKGNKIYLNFGLANLFLFFWMTGTLTQYIDLEFIDQRIHTKISYLTGIWLAHYFYLFTYYFPLKKSISEKTILVITYLLTICTSIYIFTTTFVRSATLDFPFRYVDTEAIPLTFFLLYFCSLSILGLFNLLNSYKINSGVYKVQSRKLFVGTSIIVLTNLVFSLTIFYYSKIDLTLLGIFFTFIFVLYTNKILFFTK